MNIIQTIKRLFSTRSLPLRGDLREWEEIGLLERTDAGVRVSPSKALGHAPLWRGLMILSGMTARTELHVYQDTPENSHRRATEHPAYWLLRRRPNRFMHATTFKKLMTFHSIFYGGGFAEIQRNGRDEPANLIPLDPQTTKTSQEAGQLWYRVNEQRRIHADDVLHIKSTLSHDGLCGLPLYRTLADALAVGLAARSFGAKFFSEGMQAAGVIGVEGMTDEQAPEFNKALQKITGPDAKHKLAAVPGRPYFVPISTEPEKAQLLGLREYEDTKTVANILGLPPHLLGSGDSTSYASLEQENMSLLANTYDPILREWESEVALKLLGDDPSYFAEFNRNALMSMDAATRAAIYNQGIQFGYRTRNEVRRSENLPTLGPEGDVPLVPANMTTIDKLTAEPEPTTPPAQQPRFSLNGQGGGDDGE